MTLCPLIYDSYFPPLPVKDKLQKLESLFSKVDRSRLDFTFPLLPSTILLYITTRPFPFFFVCHIALATCAQSHKTHRIQAKDWFKEEGLRTSIILLEKQNFTRQIYFCQKNMFF